MISDSVEEAARGGGEIKQAYVREIFSEIAPRYDLLNHLLSFNIDRRWRREALRTLAWQQRPGGLYLDLCAGTLDVGAALSSEPEFSGMVLGVDFAVPMLKHGKGKAPPEKLAPVAADALRLPLPNASVDGAIVAFGIRNVASLDAALHEVFRVLRPGARFVILEFSTPRSKLVRTGYHAYFHHLLPLAGRLISGHGSAYRYLPKSVAYFPAEDELADAMRGAGFNRVQYRTLTMGIAAIHSGEVPAGS